MGSIQEFGLGLIRSGHGSTSAIQRSLTQLEEARFELDQAWLKRRTTLEQARTLQVTRVQRLYAGIRDPRRLNGSPPCFTPQN